MSFPQPITALLSPDDTRNRNWRTGAITAAVLTIGLEAWDAFHISQPAGAAIAIVLFSAGITWLIRRGGRGPVVYLSVLFALELILNFTIFGVLGDIQHQGSWIDFFSGLGYTVASLGGLLACLALTAARPRASEA